MIFGSPERLLAPADDRRLSAPLLTLGEGGGSSGGGSSSSGQDVEALDRYVGENYSYQDMERLVRVWGIVVAGKKTDGVQANMLAFSPDAKRAYDDSMAFLEDLVDHAEAIGDSKVISKLGRLKTENFHAQIGGFAVLRILLRIASTFTSDLLQKLRGDPIKITEAMEIISSQGHELLGIVTQPWREFPKGVNAIAIHKTDVECAFRFSQFDVEDYLLIFRLCTVEMFKRTTTSAVAATVGGEIGAPQAGSIPLPSGLTTVPPQVVLHFIKRIFGVGATTPVGGRTICLRDLHRTGRDWHPVPGFNRKYFSSTAGVLKFLSVINAVVDFMNDFARNWDASADLQEIVQSPVATLSFVFEDKTRWFGTLTFHSPVTPSAEGASLRLEMLDGLMNAPEFFNADPTLRQNCFDSVTNILKGQGATPSVVEHLSEFRGDIEHSQRMKMCKCASAVLPLDLLVAHSTIVISGGEAVPVNHSVIESPKKKTKTSTGSKGGGAEQEQEKVRSASTDDSGEKDESSSEDDDESSSEDESSSDEEEEAEEEEEEEEDDTWEYAVWNIISAGKDVTWSDLQDLKWQWKTGSGGASFFYFPPDILRSAVPKNAKGQYFLNEDLAVEYAKERAEAMFGMTTE